MPLIESDNLRKSFGDTEVLRGLTFRVEPGEFVCVWGPSGAGKSTLLHVLGLMTPPSGGALSLFGEDVSGLTARKSAGIRNRKIGFLFQFHHLLPDFTVLENVMIPLLLRGDSAVGARAKARPLLERLGMGPRLDHRPAETSGGEQQRTALARALVTEPALVLADEPTGNLDRENGEKVEKLLEEEVRARGAALVLVTHNELLARRADRRLTIVDGVIMQGVPS
jgi:lipoprotein-releasing system ATP-binding protein